MRDVPNTRRARLPLAARSLAAGAARRGIQIGPRLPTLGGSVGKAAGNVVTAAKKGVVDTGHAVGKIADNKYAQMAAAAALTASGVGAPAAAGIMAGMAGGGELLAPGGNIGGALSSAAKAGVGSYGAGKLASNIPGVHAFGDAVKSRAGDLLSHIPGAGAVSSIAGGISDRAKGLLEHVPDSLKGMVSGGGSDGQGSFGALGDELGRVKSRVMHGESPIAGLGGGDGGGMSLLDKLLMGGTVAAGAMDELDKRNLRNKAIDAVTGSYDARAPLRSRAMALLADDQPRDMTSTFSDPGNVYDRQRRARALIAAPASAPTPTG